MDMGTPFPKIKARSLAGTEFTLPDVAKGQVTLVAIAFRRQAQRMLDSWLVPFERACEGQRNVTVYEVPMIEGRMFKWMASTIDAGMRAGIPKEKHDHVVTYYGNAAKYRQILAMDERSLGYVFLLDPEGQIRWHGQGFAEPEEIERMIALTKEIATGT
jgi:hypothetical protein